MTARLLPVSIGFIPLVDAAILIAARERGFAEEEGLDIDLVKETSWANIRDRLAIGHFGAAHLLAPMALAGSLGLPPLPVPVIAPMTLGTGRNALTISTSLAERLSSHGYAPGMGAAATAHCLKQACAAGPYLGRAPVFAVVHPYSSHAYFLRYWLASAGLDPDRDVSIEIVPPPFMSDALVSGRIDGCFVGEPWNSVAAAGGAGHIIATSETLWPGSPDKVLGFRRDWAHGNHDTVLRLIRAAYRAALWCDDAANTEDLASLLAQPAYLGTPVRHILPGVRGGLMPKAANDRPFTFARDHATFPWRSHAVWFHTQMARWGQAAFSSEARETVRAAYRPDLYREALKDIAADLPGDDDKTETGFFDGRVFSPGDAEAYLRAFI